MYNLLLAFKRAFRHVYSPALLIFSAFIIAVTPSLGREEAVPPAGVCDLDGTQISARVVKNLTSDGFILYDSEAALHNGVTKRELDCAVIIKEGFSKAVSENRLKNSVIFISTPTSFADELYKNHVSAAIFTEAVPTVAADVIASDYPEDKDSIREDIANEYNSRMNSGLLFSFDVHSISAAKAHTDERAEAYLMFFSSIIIFSLVMYGVCALHKTDIVALGRRIGVKTVLTSVIIPDLIIRMTGITLSTILAALIEMSVFKSSIVLHMLPAMISYIIAITAFSLMSAAVLWSLKRIKCLTFILFLTALVFCPAYLDIALLFDGADLLRLMVPPYWLWHFVDYPYLAIASPIALIFALWAFCARTKHKINR